MTHQFDGLPFGPADILLPQNCDLRGFSRFMKRRRGLVPADTEIRDIDPKGLDTAFWGSVSKEDIYEYLYFLNRECGNKKSSTARRLASLHGFYDYLVNQAVSYTHLDVYKRQHLN